MGLDSQPLRMPRKPTWVDRQQQRHDSPFFRLLDGSFLFRLTLSAAGALALLLVVNSYATCRNNRWASGCLWRDAEALSRFDAFFLHPDLEWVELSRWPSL